jgi:hypothetical protein
MKLDPHEKKRAPKGPQSVTSNFPFFTGVCCHSRSVKPKADRAYPKASFPELLASFPDCSPASKAKIPDSYSMTPG